MVAVVLAVALDWTNLSLARETCMRIKRCKLWPLLLPLLLLLRSGGGRDREGDNDPFDEFAAFVFVAEAL